MLQWSSFKVPLEHYHYNTYRTRGDDIEDEMVVFQLGADGEVASFDALGVTFAKVKTKR